MLVCYFVIIRPNLWHSAPPETVNTALLYIKRKKKSRRAFFERVTDTGMTEYICVQIKE